MNKLPRWHTALWIAAILAAGPVAQAQQSPNAGYVFPAGGRRGTTLEVTVGGQYLNGVSEAYVSGKGVQAKVIKYVKPLSRKQMNDLGRKLRDLQKKRTGAAKKKEPRVGLVQIAQEFKTFATKMGLKEMDMKAFLELRKKFLDPKRQPNPQIAELVILRITLAADAEPGERELRLKTALGISNPLVLHVGQCPEYSEKEPNDTTPDGGIPTSLPVIVNGQVMPGDVDRFRFKARKGMHLVAAVSARELIPYLADAVPGWFQATLTLSDAKGNEVAYTDDFRFHPDPVIHYEVPADGEYILEIKDAIYRGREDFVYRVALGEVPFVTGIFPMGGRAGARTTVELAGWNLPPDGLTVDTKGKGAGILPVSVRKDKRVSNTAPFALDTLPERLETEPNNNPAAAQQVKLPLIVNGRIDRPGDWDVFRFAGRAGHEVVVEVRARRLGSPLDSFIKLTRADGRQLAVNDDHADKGAGLTTHQADSRLSVKLPADGSYLLHLGDTQHKGGTAYGYRLRISPPRPDFELRVVPSAINARAGMTIPIVAYALRNDGFSGQIALTLKDAPSGFVLSGGWIPPGQEKVRLTLTVPSTPLKEPVRLGLEGRATVKGKEIRRQAVPAEDRMQAFLYRHLVPTQDWIVSVTGKGRYGPPLKLVGNAPARLPAGGTGKVRIAGPRGAAISQVRLELDEPPAGVAIKKISPDKGGIAILLSVDAKKAKPGLKGNLIVNASTERSWKAKDGKSRKRRVSLGAMPAIPFEIVAATPPGATKRN